MIKYIYITILHCRVHGRMYRLVNKGSLGGVSAQDMPAALALLTAPAALVFTPVVPPTFSDDHIAGKGVVS
jgi:hypothetical protein